MLFGRYPITNIIKRTIILYSVLFMAGYGLLFGIMHAFAINLDPSYEAGTPSVVVGYCGGSPGDGRSYCRRNCTSYVAYKLASLGVSPAHYMNNGNGKDWDDSARAKGISIGSAPKVGAVAYWNSGGGDYGHVGWVDSVNGDGSVNTSNYNGLTEEFYKQNSARPDGYIYFSNVANQYVTGGNSQLTSDVDGNGGSDLVMTTSEPTGGTAAIVALSTYQGFLAPQKWWNNNTFGWSGVTPLVGDVDGDKVADYVFLTNEGVNGTKAWVAKSTKTGLTTPQLWWNGKGYGYSGIKASLR